MNQDNISLEDKTIIVSIPVTFSRKFGRRWMIVPPSNGAPVTRTTKHDDTLLTALSRAHKWARWLETGRVRNLEQLAEEHKTMILDGTQPRTMKLSEMLKPFPDDWAAQRRYFGLAA
jgi:hypothetical protein